MDYNDAQISMGKIRSYDTITGEIVAKDGIYIFTQDNIVNGEEIKPNDMVVFRGEMVQDVRVAYFIKKLTPSKNIEDQIYTKTKGIKFLKENE